MRGNGAVANLGNVFRKKAVLELESFVLYLNQFLRLSGSVDKLKTKNNKIFSVADIRSVFVSASS